MSIMDRLTSAETTFKHALSVAEEIATLGEDLVKQLEAHRDDIKAASGALLGGVGTVAQALKAEAAVAQVAGAPVEAVEGVVGAVEGAAAQFLGRAA